jgi:hypothetical protein
MTGIECNQAYKRKMYWYPIHDVHYYEDDEKVFEALKAGALVPSLKKTSKDKIAGSLWRELHNGGQPHDTNIARKGYDGF